MLVTARQVEGYGAFSQHTQTLGMTALAARIAAMREAHETRHAGAAMAMWSRRR